MGPWCEPSMLVWAAVDSVIQKIVSDAAIVQKCIPLPGCTVTDNPLALALKINQNLKHFSLGLFDLFGKRRVDLHPVVTGAQFPVSHFQGSFRYRFGFVLHMPSVNPDGSAVGFELFHVKKRDSVLGKNSFTGDE